MNNFPSDYKCDEIEFRHYLTNCHRATTQIKMRDIDSYDAQTSVEDEQLPIRPQIDSLSFDNISQIAIVQPYKEKCKT
jgi:hypothetical protein